MNRFLVFWLALYWLSVSGAAPLTTAEREAAFIEARDDLEREAKVAALLPFDDGGRLASTATKRAASLTVDVFAGFTPLDPDLSLGLALVVYHKRPHRLSVQVADGALGAGIARTVIPVLDVAIGVGALYRFESARFEPELFVSAFRW